MRLLFALSTLTGILVALLAWMVLERLLDALAALL